MKKRVLLILMTVLFASLVYAADSMPLTDSVTDLPKIERQTNFMGDNVHILLIEDLAEKMGVQVEELDQKLLEMQQRIDELEQMKSSMSGIKTTGHAVQLNTINTELGDLRQSVNDIKQLNTEMKMEKDESSLGGYIMLLLGLNGSLLIIVSGIIIKKSTQKEQTRTLHEYIANCLDAGESEEEIKEDLLSEGWPEERIEKALDEL